MPATDKKQHSVKKVLNIYKSTKIWETSMYEINNVRDQ